MIKNNTVYAILAITVVMLIAQITKNYMLFAYSMPTLIFAFIYLGSIKQHKLPETLAVGWGILYLLVLITLVSMLKMVETPENITKDLIFGLPKATFILLAVFWALTGILTTGFYALRFDKDILSEESYEEFKKVASSSTSKEV